MISLRLTAGTLKAPGSMASIPSMMASVLQGDTEVQRIEQA
jgi:hypothetical protein